MLSFAVGWMTSMLWSPIVYYGSWPARLKLFAWSELFDIGLLYTVWACAAVILVLFALSLRRPLSPATSALTVASVLPMQVMYRAVPARQSTGRWLIWMFERDFLLGLPLALAAWRSGWCFVDWTRCMLHDPRPSPFL